MAEVVVTHDSVDLCWVEAAVKRAWRREPGRYPLYEAPPGEVSEEMVERAMRVYQDAAPMYCLYPQHDAMRAALQSALSGRGGKAGGS